MMNHGLYSDTDWSVAVQFTSADGSAPDLSNIDFVMDVLRAGDITYTFRSDAPAVDEGTIGTDDAAAGILYFTADSAAHEDLNLGLYRVHLKGDDIDWHAEGTMLIGSPGAHETYLKFDETAPPGITSATLGIVQRPVIRFREITEPGDDALLPSDIVVLVNKTVGEATVITLNSPVVKRGVWIKDFRGDASVYPIIITPPSGTIDGLVSVVISADWGVIYLAATGSVWTVLGS
jgi:hypothetical protein